MNQSELIKNVKTRPLMRQVFLTAVQPLSIFLIGFIPIWLKDNDYSRILVDEEKQKSLVRIEKPLATAVICAQQADYEQALKETSKFFISLRNETDNLNNSVFSHPETNEIMNYFTQQEDLITLLSHKDPTSASQLYELYVSFCQIAR
jgi:hypothetical protein